MTTLSEPTNQLSEGRSRAVLARRKLSARIEPFDSYWQAPRDVEKGYTAFYQYYKHNFLPHVPLNKEARILVVSCGPGYLVNLLNQQGYTNVLGIDSDSAKIKHATKRNFNCIVAHAFPFLEENQQPVGAIICEQELNHLTIDEAIEFLRLCWKNLESDGVLIVYGLNGANPIVGAENLAHNIDHFNTFTEYSLTQILHLAGFENVKLLPLKLYVFWTNPLNYVGFVVTGFLSLCFRICFAIYGKNVKILTKKIAAVCRKHA
jgi:2-polyprenyl-3-methyl-5-hydroxy-6-metoxy-1,4-benzoquinol methylase